MNLELITPQTASNEVKPLLEKVQKAYGFIPNTYGAMAHSPLAVAAYLGINDLIAKHSTLSPQEQQVVMLSISLENSCEYCVAAHSTVAAMVKTAPDVVEAIRNDTPVPDERLAALSRFAKSLVKNRGWVPEAEQEAFFSAGYTPAHALEVVAINAMKALSNYTNHLADTPLDEAFAAQAWQKPA